MTDIVSIILLIVITFGVSLPLLLCISGSAERCLEKETSSTRFYAKLMVCVAMLAGLIAICEFIWLIIEGLAQPDNMLGYLYIFLGAVMVIPIVLVAFSIHLKIQDIYKEWETASGDTGGRRLMRKALEFVTGDKTLAKDIVSVVPKNLPNPLAKKPQQQMPPQINTPNMMPLNYQQAYQQNGIVTYPPQQQMPLAPQQQQNFTPNFQQNTPPSVGMLPEYQQRFQQRFGFVAGPQNSTDSCSICRMGLVTGTLAAKAVCGHTFDISCLAGYTARESSCPICKTSFYIGLEGPNPQQQGFNVVS